MHDIISFDQIDKHGPQEVRGTYAVTPDELGRIEVAETANISIHARAEKGNLPGEYIVDGSSSFTTALTCSRCAEPYPFAQ